MIYLEETDNRFYVECSTIPNANKGLFAKHKILKGETIEIIGVFVKRNSLSDICTTYAKNYKYKFKEYSLIPLGFAAMINFTPYEHCANVTTICSDKIYLELIKDVEANEELFFFGGETISEAIETRDNLHNDIEKNSLDNNEFLKNYPNFSFLLD